MSILNKFLFLRISCCNIIKLAARGGGGRVGDRALLLSLLTRTQIKTATVGKIGFIKKLTWHVKNIFSFHTNTRCVLNANRNYITFMIAIFLHAKKKIKRNIKWVKLKLKANSYWQKRKIRLDRIMIKKKSSQSNILCISIGSAAQNQCPNVFYLIPMGWI